MIFFKYIVSITKIIFLFFLMSFACVIIVNSVFFPYKNIINSSSIEDKKNNKILVNIIKKTNSNNQNLILLLKNPDVLCKTFSKFVHVNKTITCQSLKLVNSKNDYSSKKQFETTFIIEKGNGKALLVIFGNLEFNKIDVNNQIIIMKGTGNIKLKSFPNYYLDAFINMFNRKIGGDFDYDLKFETINNNSGIRLSGNIFYGVDFVPTFVYMPTKIINRFANQIISQSLDFLMKNL